MKKYQGELFLIITAMIWGSGFVASAIALDFFTPYQILAGRFLVGVLILSAIFYKRLVEIKISTWIRGSIIGVFLYIAFLLQTVGLQYTTPSKNAFLTAINVIIVPFIAFVIYRRKISLNEVIGAIIAVIGVGVISLKVSTTINLGDFLTLLCAFAFAFQIFFTSKYVKDEDPVLLTIVQLMVAGAIGLLVVFLIGDTTVLLQAKGVTSLLYLGAFSTTLAYLLQTYAQKTVSETKTAIILSMEAVWGMFFSIIILNELITIKMIIGAILIIVAIIVSETKFDFTFKRKSGQLY